jgi:hypothetical protein
VRSIVPLALSCLLLAPLAAAQTGDHEHLRYRWTDAAGQIHLSDEVPVEAARLGYDVINQYGSVVRHVEGAKTAEQLAAQKQADQAAKRAADQQRIDQQLLLSYPTEADLVAAQNDHLQMLRQRIEATEINMKSQLDNLATVLGEAADYKQRGEKVPVYLQQQITKQREVIRGQRDWIAKSQTELADTTAQSQAQLQRYHELKQSAANGH